MGELGRGEECSRSSRVADRQRRGIFLGCSLASRQILAKKGRMGCVRSECGEKKGKIKQRGIWSGNYGTVLFRPGCTSAESFSYQLVS